MRSITAICLLLSGPLLLSGCAAGAIVDTRDQMVGMSKDQLLSCLGTPSKEIKDGKTQTQIYEILQGTSSICEVTAKLENDKVMAVDYSSTAVTQLDSQCVGALARCAR